MNKYECELCGGEIEEYPYSPVELYGYGCKECGAQWERKQR